MFNFRRLMTFFEHKIFEGEIWASPVPTEAPSTARSPKPTLASLEQVEQTSPLFSDIWSSEVYLITIQRDY